MADFPELMDVRQAAIFLGISADTLYNYAQNKIVPCFRLGNRWRFSKRHLEAWVDRQAGVTDFDKAKKGGRN